MEVSTYRSALIVPLVILTACSSSEPTADGGATTDSGIDSPSTATIPAGCEQTPKGCLIFRCNCENGTTSRTFADKTGGGCKSGLETCTEICQLVNSRVVEPISCNRKEAEPDASTPTPTTDAGPKPGKPGGPCDLGSCTADKCECKDGSAMSPAGGICRNNVCSSLEETCKLACEENGGWTGVGIP